METNTARNLYYIQDQCWSIPVVAACAAFLISAVDSSRGYLYVLYMDKYGIDRATAAWPDSILAVTRNLSGFAVTLLQSRLSVFSMTLLSVAVCSGGMIAGAFAPNIVWTAVAVGGFYGAFRDTLGSYDNLYRVLGALNLFGAMLLFLLVFRDRARRRTWDVNKVTATTSNHAAGH